MEPKSLLPHLQVTASCLYPEPDQSSPCLPNPTNLLTLNFFKLVFLSGMLRYFIFPGINFYFISHTQRPFQSTFFIY
jgi:hypothetical protein